MRPKKEYKIKYKYYKTILTDIAKECNKCGYSKMMANIDNVEFYVRIVINKEDYQ